MSLKKISQQQKIILKNCNKFLTQERKKNIDTSISPLCFFTVWAKTPGYFKIYDLNGFKKNQLIFTFKNLLSISKNFDKKLFLKNKKISSSAHNLIISYSTKQNFDFRGNFFDNNFNFDSKNKNFFWLLISLDNYVPPKIQENIAIIAKKNNTSFSLKYLLKHLMQTLIISKFNVNTIKHYCWQEFNFSKLILETLKKILNNLKIENLILNYEGVPFQNYVINEIKKINNKLKTIGYLHCAPWPLQLDLIYKNQALDMMIVSGQEQKKVLRKYYGWSKKNINVIPSLRFERKKQKEFSGFIFVPYNLENEFNYLKRFEMYLAENKKISCNFKVRIHPLNLNSKPHLDFKNKCEILLSKYAIKKKGKPQNHSLLFGSATGVCIQALEEGTTITHFPNDENLDVFSPTIWSNLNVKKSGEKTYIYKLKKKNYTFLTNNQKKKFQKYFKPLLKKPH